MLKIVLTFGLISGAIVIGAMILGLVLVDDDATSHTGELFGYLIMIVALSVIFVGIKRYRDQELGGVIRFGQALLVGLGISAVAGVVYVVGWEGYLAATDYAFIDEYTAAAIEAKREAGVTGAELEETIASMEEMKQMYGNPLFRLPMTFLEIFPVGLLISLISAAILRNRKILPAAA